MLLIVVTLHYLKPKMLRLKVKSYKPSHQGLGKLLFIEVEGFSRLLNIHLVDESLNNIIRGCVISNLVKIFAMQKKILSKYLNLTLINSAALGLNLN